MHIKSIEILHLQMPMKFSFSTAKALVSERETLIIIVRDHSGIAGYGEVVAFNEPFYTAETLNSALTILKTKYIPAILATDILHPFEVHSLFSKSSPMALAGLENALADLYAKQRGHNLIEMIFQEKLQSTIDVGIALGHMHSKDLLNKVAEYVQLGCKRFKFKIIPENISYENLLKVRSAFPDIIMLGDANASFSLDAQGIKMLEQYNNLNLVCIEEAFNFSAKPLHRFSASLLAHYAHVLAKLNFKICCDESLLSLEDMHKAYENNVLQMINVKIGRLGGLFYAQKVIEFCRQHKIAYFIGSMLESGISKVLHVQLAALKGSCMAGDLSDSQRYFDNDIIVPAISSKNGKISVCCESGIGVEVDNDMIRHYAKQAIIFD